MEEAYLSVKLISKVHLLLHLLASDLEFLFPVLAVFDQLLFKTSKLILQR